MNEFKVGDRVTMRAGAKSRYNLEIGGMTGRVTHPNYVTSTPCMVGILIPGMNSDTTILVHSEDIVTEPSLEDRVAALEAALGEPAPEPEYVMPEVPKKGDYVRLTMEDGSTKQGGVTDVFTFRYPDGSPREHKILLTGKSVLAYIFEHEDYIKELNRPSWTVVKVEKIDRPLEIPEVGRWIEATTEEGKTHTFEVNENTPTAEWGTFLWNGYRSPLGNGHRPVIGGSYPKSNIVKWHYVNKPASEWKVGDVVPAGTKVGRERLAGGVGYREILWIEAEDE